MLLELPFHFRGFANMAIKTKFIFIIFLFVLFLANNVFAARIGFDYPITFESIESDIDFIFCWVTRTGFLLIIIFIIWTGIRMLSSGSSPERFSQAGKAFKSVLIGGMVILGAGAIINTIAYALLGFSFIIPVMCTVV